MTSAFSYPFLPFINYPPFLPFSSAILFIMFFSSFLRAVDVWHVGPSFWSIQNIWYSIIYAPTTLFLSLSLTIIFFPKSAQLPLSSRSLNATSAPTPVSPPSHSPTTVIAGVYSGSIMQPIIMLVIDSFRLVVVILLVVPLYPLIRSIFKAISLSDIKSLIAFSTISQISYMFLAINGASTLVSPFHIIIHALFKSLSSLLSGSPIHVQPNFQSIYKPKINHSLINIIRILAGSVLIVPLSKEGIIHSSNCILSPAFVTMIAVLGGIFTMIYTWKIYCFLSLSPLNSGANDSSTIPDRLG